MNMVPVKSSNVAEIGYAPESRVLRIKFKNGGEYDHRDVPPEAHAALMEAESHGGHYAKHIRGKYGHQKAEAKAE